MRDVEESIEQVNEILEPESFSIVDAITGTSRPEDTVRVYTDRQAAQDLLRMNAEMEEIANRQERGKEIDLEYYEALEDQAQQLREKLLESSYVFTLRGLSRDEWEVDRNRLRDSDLSDMQVGHEYTILVFARSLVKVEDSKGRVDEREFTVSEAEVIYNMLPPSEWERVNEAIQQLTFASAYFDQAVDAGFLPQR